MSQSHQTALGIDTVAPVTRGYEFQRCTIAKTAAIIDTSGLRGSRAHLASRTRRGPETIAGEIELTPSAGELAALLPWILGAPAVGNTYALAETLADRCIQVDKVAGVFTYAGCRVNRATFFGSAGAPMRLRLEIVGRSESRSAAGTFPAVAYRAGSPFLFSDGTLVLLGTPREVRQWSVEIDHHLVVSLAGSTSAARIIPADRTVALRCTLPFTVDEADLYDQALPGAGGVLTLAGPSATLAFHFAALQVPAHGPAIEIGNELTLLIEAVARKLDAASELTVTLT